MTEPTPTPTPDFDFDAATAEFTATPMGEVIRTIEAAGRKIVLSPTGEELVAVNESNEVSLYAAVVEHNGEVCLTFLSTRHMTKFTDWMSSLDSTAPVAAYHERSDAPGSCHRVYVTA